MYIHISFRVSIKFYVLGDDGTRNDFIKLWVHQIKTLPRQKCLLCLLFKTTTVRYRSEMLPLIPMMDQGRKRFLTNRKPYADCRSRSKIEENWKISLIRKLLGKMTLLVTDVIVKI